MSTTGSSDRTERLPNYIRGEWMNSDGEPLPVENPATLEVLGDVPCSTPPEVDAAVTAARKVFPEWRQTPATDRVQFLFRYKQLLEEHLETLARNITNENGKTYAESVGELRRGIENVETACGIPILMQGYNNEDIARGIDEHMFREPLGVVAAITPFNFPAMIPLWFLPYAIATGNCFILKPSERTPITAIRLFELLHETGLPAGVAQLVHGSRQTVDVLLAHPEVRAISFVGSTPVARHIYATAAQHGKRVQCQAGAKNPVVVMPDADMDSATQVIADAAFGCAGQRCLALSTVVTVGGAREAFVPRIAAAAESRRIGCGLDEGVEMGPVITAASKARITELIAKGQREGACILTGGAGGQSAGTAPGHFLAPTLLEDVARDSELAHTEIFGPVLALAHSDSIDDAIAFVNAQAFGNMACIFTSSGAHARHFRYHADAGNIGINVGVAAPMAFFPFSGWNASFLGDLHAQGRHAVEFYTQTKVVVERWPKEWSRKF